MDAIEIIAVMTGVELTEEELYGRKATPVRKLLASIAYKIESADRELERAAQEMDRLTAKIRANLTAKPGERYYPLSATGEMNGSALGRLDGIIAQRATLIESLQMVMSLDREPKAETPALRLREIEPMTIKGYND